MQFKSKKPFLLFLIPILSATALVAAAGAPPKYKATVKPAAKGDVIIREEVYTPVGITSDMGSTSSDGSKDPSLSMEFGQSSALLQRIQKKPLRYKVLSLKRSEKPLSRLSTVTFFLQVYLVTFDVTEKRAKLVAVTNNNVRKAWQYSDAGTFKKWPAAGVSIPVSQIGTIKQKLHYVGGTLNGTKNYMFVVYQDTPQLDDLFASTNIHVVE